MIPPFANLPPNFNISPDGMYAVLTSSIEKSANDDRSYRLIRLNNELEALLIHDPETDKSGAALDVNVGNLSDPDNLGGLAHFCEHLLFMGTEKYPKENEYMEYLTKHNGYSNAFTSMDHTNYYFEVGSQEGYLEGALDRFAQFFITPLFDPSCTDRELNAVDSEYKKNLQSDSRRLSQLEKSLSNPKHPYSRFGSGNLVTLRDLPLKDGLDVREELLKFHKKYYSANIMKLAILGKEPLDQMTRWVVEKFSDVTNKNIPIPTFDGHPLTENELMRQIYVKPVKEIRALNITFPYPDQTHLYTIKPGRYLSYLIGHEGIGSILTLLKKKGWANDLGSSYNNGAMGFDFFKISLDLTEEGLDHYQEVVKIVFQYIEMLKRVGVQERLFREIQSLCDISFQFNEKSSSGGYCSMLAGIMHKPYEREWIISGPHLIRNYDPHLIAEGLESLCSDKFYLTLVSKTFTDLNQKEKWYGVEHRVKHIDEEFIKELQTLTIINPELTIPIPNEFIPTNFETHKHEVTTSQMRPNLVKNTSLTRLWHKKDDVFWVPKANLYFMFNSPLAYMTPLHFMKAKLYVDLVVDSLAEYSYNARVAGLNYDLYMRTNGIALVIKGYNDKLHILLEKIVQRMKKLSVDPKRFALIKEQLQRTYRSSFFDQPYQHSMYYLSYITEDKIWLNEEKLEALENITTRDVEIFYPELISNLHIESLIHGNIFKDDALRIVQIVEDILKPNPLLPSQLIRDRSVLLPLGKRYYYQRDAHDPDNVNSAIEYYIQVGNLMDKAVRSRSSLLAQIANEPCFDQLRAKEQLGYIVHSGLRRLAGSIGIRFVIQSEKDPIHLENRIEEFLNQLQVMIEEFSEEEYQKQIQSLIARKLEKPKNLSQETGRYWGHITSGYYNFYEVDIDVEELRTITKHDLLGFYKQFIHPSSQIQKKLSVHFLSHKLNQPKPIDINNFHLCLIAQGLTNLTIEDLQAFFASNETLSGSKLEESLKQFLIDKSKVQEDRIDELIESHGKFYLNGNNFDGEKIKNGLNKERGLRVENENIDDIIIWKSHMELGPAPTPVTIFSELLSKL